VLTTVLDRTAGWPTPLVLAVAAVLLLAESGTLVGLLLPGTTLLVALGLWSAATGVPAAAPLAVAAAATVGGALRGWERGRRPGPVPPGRAWTRAEPWIRRLPPWPAASGTAGTSALLAAGHWASAARTLTPRAAGAAGVPLRVAGPTLAVSGTAWATTVVVLGRELGPRVVASAQWAPVAVLAVVAGAVLIKALLARRVPLTGS
jgi:membrane-associated protein